MTWTTTTDTGIRNVHTRHTPGTLDDAWALIAELGSPGSVWPEDAWPPMVLDAGLRVGSRGGHADVRYTVTDVRECESVTLTFDEGAGFTGWHRFDIEKRDDGVLWTHTLVLDAPRLLDRHVVIPLHDALLEDLLSNAQARSGGHPPAPTPYTPAVRVLRAVFQQMTKRPLPTHRPHASADASVAALAGLAALHGIWGMGVAWPAKDANRLAEVVGGRAPLPGPGPCWTVAGLLGLAAVTMHSANRPTSRAAVMPYPVADVGVAVLGAVLAVRAAGVVGSVVPSRMSRSFRLMNAAVYSPLCAGLAAACFARVRWG